MTLSELRDALAKVSDEVEGDPEVFIDVDESTSMVVENVTIDDDGDIRLY